MKNNLYLTQADSESFDAWFANSYHSIHPESKLSHRLCQNVTIVVTEDCNFACTYCYMHDKKPKSMSIATGKDVVDFILSDERTNGYISSIQSPGIVLDFIGGEPLLEIELIDEFMEYFIFRTTEMDHPWKDNFMISMSSNGALYDTPEVQRFIDKFKGRVSIGITIDGTKALHDACRIYKDGQGTYDDVLNAVKRRFMNGEHPSTKVTLAPENLSYLMDAALHLFDIGYKFVNANVVFEDVWKIEHAKMFYLELKKLADHMLDNELYTAHYISLFTEGIGQPMDPNNNSNWCGGDGSMLAIGTDGRCYPCLRYMTYTFANRDREALEIGNIYDGIEDSETSETISCLKCITRRSQSTDECFDCTIASECAWCSAYNYDVFGTADKRTVFHCDMHKARVLANAYYWNKLYKKLRILKTFKLSILDDVALSIIDQKELDMLKEISK